MDDVQKRDTRYVVGGARLLTTEAIDELRRSEGIRSLVRDMRALEREVSSQLEGMTPTQLHASCQRAIAELAPRSGLDETCGGMDATSFARTVYDLPMRLSDASERRAAREVARTYAQLCEGGLVMPESIDDFHRLWEAAMEGEPRWSADFPTSEFRRVTATVIRSLLSGEVTQVCTDPANVEAELGQLLSFLSDESLEPEVRATCAFLSLEFTHPFVDGNGHVGRMLLLATIQGRYSLPTMLCLSRELVLGRGKASHQFALVRSGEHGVADFCNAMLSHLHEAQRSVADLLLQPSSEERGRHGLA